MKGFSSSIASARALVLGAPSQPRAVLISGFLPDLSKPLGFALSRVWSSAYFLVVLALVLGGIAWTSSTSSVSLVDQLGLVASDFIGIWSERPVWAPEPYPYWPIWRDVLTVVIVLSMAATPALAAFQWNGYRRLIAHMKSAGSLRPTGPNGPAIVNRRIEQANNWIYRARLLRVPILLTSFGVVLLIFQAQLAFHSSPGGVFDIDHQVVDRWWIAGSGAIEALYFLVGTLGIYIVTMQNLVGFIVIITIARARANLAFGADYLNADRYWGWRPVRTILWATYAEIITHAVGLIAALLAMPHVGLAYVVASIPAVEWMLTLPVYVAAPIVIISLSLRSFRVREVAALQAAAAQRGHVTTYPVELERRFARFNEIPRIPFARLPERTLFLVAQIANFSACYGLVLALISGRDTPQ